MFVCERDFPPAWKRNPNWHRTDYGFTATLRDLGISREVSAEAVDYFGGEMIHDADGWHADGNELTRSRAAEADAAATVVQFLATPKGQAWQTRGERK
jgi:hypothetical protein